MPHKIGFTVISWSGHEGNYSAKKLMVHAPTVTGWRSTRFCPFPQEIILELVERCRIRKLQLLAHQYLVPSKIEFHIGDRLPESSSHQQANILHRLGYVSLSDNEKTGFKARELKSVHVDAVGSYLKLTFHRNHVNQYNNYNQVALVALNILGDPVDGNDIGTALSRDQLIDQYLNNSQYSSALDGTYTGLSSYKCESISPLDDLAFDMYQDPEVAHIIRLLDQKKQGMVREERFDVAKKLKQAIADLQKVGERLGRYDVEKHSAIEREEYDIAKQKKEQMEAYRLTIYQHLELHSLLDISQIHRISEISNSEFPSPRAGTQKHTPHPADSPTKRRQGQHVKETNEQDTSKPASPKHSVTPTPLTPPHASKIDISSLPYDERPLPAFRKRLSDQPVSELDEMPPLTDTSSPRSPESSGQPEPLTEKAQREASLPIEIYGDCLVAASYSKTWSYREDALLTVYKKLMEVPPGTPKAELRSMMRAAVFLCKKALTDKVSSVFLTSMNLLRMILSEFIPNHQLGKSEISHCVEQTWNNLLFRTGDSTLRLRTLAVTFIREMASFKEVRALQMVPLELVKPMQSSVPARLALSRLELLEKLLEQLGTKNSGFTLDNVMRFLSGGLEHSAASVRELSVRVVQDMYRRHGKAVLNYLPPDDTSTRKNVLYKNLFDSFTKLDGNNKNMQKTKKVSELEDGEREKEEIRSLQEQLAVLKEISEKGKENSKSPEKKTEKAAKSAVVKKVNQSVPADAKDSQSSAANYLDNLCIFCGERDASFTEDGLDLHYWKHCPMLQRCLQCRQVVEIASLTEHLLTECERRADFTQCPLCCEALPRDKLTEHAQSTACNPPASGENCNHCPLCHENFASGEEAWKSHLMGPEGCKQNSRRRAVQQSTLSHAQGKTVSTGVARTAMVISESKVQGLARGSRIPAPASRNNRHIRNPPGKASTLRLQQT
ncbi:centrosomal protein of 104 kDa isoform X1 [Rhinichthys klamathensis goyatoka]|uniref:centrosomal protein of 104 kDa isoform X1 n=1 Tax=Rhinichthys klamathensis goyatoka TaxID=3034132 RepID=UPI0024B5DA39|nr:centrosomal protein of 104 kDa isoform X1 [Rhinichthys klamathensis goyatoka]